VATWRDNIREFTVSEQSQIASAILRYLDANPHAEDTIEGIVQWWVRKDWVQQKVEEVERAIGLLKSRGFILEEPSAGIGGSLYRLNPECRETVRKLLSKTEQGEVDV
jgi:hypothetical protein